MNSLTYALQPCNADYQSAVSRNCILRGVRSLEAAVTVPRPADYKSAIRQIENLRYGFWSATSCSGEYVNGFAKQTSIWMPGHAGGGCARQCAARDRSKGARLMKRSFCQNAERKSLGARSVE